MVSGPPAPVESVHAPGLTIVHEAPVIDSERMAVVARGRHPGRGADMGQKQTRSDVMRDLFEIWVRPGWMGILVQTRCLAICVPGQAKSICVDR